MLSSISLALHTLLPTPQTRAPPARWCRLPPIRAAVTEPRTTPVMSADAAVAEWCAASGRGQAAVTVLDGQETAQVLRDFWYVSRALGESGTFNGQHVLAFPQWADGDDPRQFQRLLAHISTCSEACTHLGDSLMVIGRHPQSVATEGEATPPYPMLLLRGFATGNELPPVDEGEELPWFYSDDDDDDPFARFGETVEAPPPATDEEVIDATTKWVDAVIVHMKVCPFSGSTYRAGLPVGGVTYPLCAATTAEELYQAFWQEVENLRATDEKTLATVLLVAPQFTTAGPTAESKAAAAEAFDCFADTLNDALTTLHLEEQLQLVFFHPQYTFRDGGERAGGDGAAANYARRSPYPMVNLLRTPQVRAAQKGVPTGSVYTTNEDNLATVGAAELGAMLEAREWAPLLEKKFKAHNVDVIRGV